MAALEIPNFTQQNKQEYSIDDFRNDDVFFPIVQKVIIGKLFYLKLCRNIVDNAPVFSLILLHIFPRNYNKSI